MDTRRANVSIITRRNLAILTTLFLFLVLGCIGGGSGKTCTGELRVSGAKYNGIADNEPEAKRNTCAKYCIEGDPETEAMYRVWLDSLPANKRKNVRKGEKGKWDALYANESIKKHVEQCEKECVGSQEIPVKCEG